MIFSPGCFLRNAARGSESPANHREGWMAGDTRLLQQSSQNKRLSKTDRLTGTQYPVLKSPRSNSVTSCLGERKGQKQQQKQQLWVRGSDHLPCECVERRTTAAPRPRERSANYPKVVPDKLPSQALKSPKIHDPHMSRVFVCMCVVP